LLAPRALNLAYTRRALREAQFTCSVKLCVELIAFFIRAANSMRSTSFRAPQLSCNDGDDKGSILICHVSRNHASALSLSACASTTAWFRLRYGPDGAHDIGGCAI
jgi:hypothetical protein